jgi:hypothetical protein
MGCDTVWSSRCSLAFWRDILPLPSGSKMKSRQQTTKKQDLLVACLAYSLIMKMELGSSSETLMDVYQTIWRHISEDCMYTLQSVL